MNFFYKLYIAYFMLLTPVIALNNETSSLINEPITEIVVNHIIQVPFIIKVWIITEILINLR